MCKTPNLIENLILSSVKIGEIYVPFTALKNFIFEFVYPALFYSSDEQAGYTPEAGFPEIDGPTNRNFSLSGTTFRVKYNNRYFSLISDHQLSHPYAQFEPQQFVIFDDQKKIHCPERYIFERNSHDVGAFEFTTFIDQGIVATRAFWDLKKSSSSKTANSNYAITLGYRGIDNELDTFEHSAKFDCTVIYLEQIEPVIKNRLSYTRLRADDEHYHVDGLSGSPVFEIVQLTDHYKIRLIGLVTNSNGNYFHVSPLNGFIEALET